MADETNKYRGHLPYFILDVMKYDECEPVTSIVNMLNDYHTVGWRDHWPRDFTRDDVVQGLTLLLEKRLVKPLRYDGARDCVTESDDPVTFDLEEEVWFHMTKRGRQALSKWTPPPQ